MTAVLFVCTGNTCRSPMAEGVFNALAGQTGRNAALQAASAGVAAEEDSGPHAMAVRVCEEDGINIRSHRSRPVSDALLQQAAWVLTMTSDQKRELLRRFSGNEGKVFTLKEFVGESGDILDPIGMGEDFYRQVYMEIKEAVSKAFEKIRLRELQKGESK